MADIPSLKDGVTELMSVIELLEATDTLTPEQVWRKTKQHRKKAIKAFVQEGKSWAAATGDLPHFARPDAQEYLRSIQNDLKAQVSIFSGCVDAWFDHCTHPAPGYTWRITVLLRKAKLFDIEKRFLAAYFKHFWTERGSSRDGMLGNRAIKAGVSIPESPDTTPLPWPPASSGDSMLDHLQSQVPSLRMRVREVETTSIESDRFNIQFDFHCTSCGGTIISAPDDPDDSGPAICKACDIVFGSMEEVKALGRHIGKRWLQEMGMIPPEPE